MADTTLRPSRIAALMTSRGGVPHGLDQYCLVQLSMLREPCVCGSMASAAPQSI